MRAAITRPRPRSRRSQPTLAQQLKRDVAKAVAEAVAAAVPSAVAAAVAATIDPLEPPVGSIQVWTGDKWAPVATKAGVLTNDGVGGVSWVAT